MTILYTQLLSIPDRHILCNAFTLHGQPLQNNKRVLFSLKEIVAKVPDDAGEKIFKYEEDGFIFYIKVNTCIISIITDTTTTSNMAELYFTSVLDAFDNLSPEALLKEGNNFNMRHDYEEVNNELSVTKKICVDNLTKMVQRGETINKLEEFGARLKEASIGLNRSSRDLYYREVYRQYLMYAAVIILLVLLYFLFIK